MKENENILRPCPVLDNPGSLAMIVGDHQTNYLTLGDGREETIRVLEE